MNFELDPEVKELSQIVRGFAEKRLRWGAAVEEPGRPFPREAFRACGELGMLGVSVPREYGGSGLGAVGAAAVMESLGYGTDDLGFAFSVGAHLFACVMPIVKFGSPEQKELWLPRLVSGELIAAHAISEPEAGSDALSVTTRAERRAGGYVLNGCKAWATNSPVADLFVVQAATRPGSGFFGLTAFLIPSETQGLSVGHGHVKVGLRTAPTADVYLDDCQVPLSARLGSEGAGASVFSSSMTWERTCLLALYVGAMQRQLEVTIDYATTRHQFGVPVATFQAVSHRVVEMKLRLETARLLLFRAAWGIDRGESDAIPSALAKLFVSEAAVASSLDAIQVHGGVGVVSGQLERWLRDALPARIFSGTSEIQRNNIARELGLKSQT